MLTLIAMSALSLWLLGRLPARRRAGVASAPAACLGLLTYGLAVHPGEVRWALLASLAVVITSAVLLCNLHFATHRMRAHRGSAQWFWSDATGERSRLYQELTVIRDAAVFIPFAGGLLLAWTMLSLGAS